MSDAIIERRRIEAELLRQVYEAVRESHGEETAVDVVDRAVRKAAVAQGARFRAELGREPDLKDFKDILRFWTANDALTIDVEVAEADQLDFNVTRCRYAEMYRDMGLGALGAVLSCNRDDEFCKGYSGRMKLTRTQTIMGGASHCDFRYRLED
ncbi:L-2-amino-thiazoline-4-carboxylic acid hydrolase [Oryzibacter oryziterrae]|uniref:L-2-amino-thiazoline-4-carboxylic acid hydrolase n=1 Tax=Oryzibacter oryziterrae TaxID=2766474 RepID=UPI001F3C6CF0|nr:L-2-amino-thiazoline-4-carboxylic acid hydrolase [Oryzibacter oryziterrae]